LGNHGALLHLKITLLAYLLDGRVPVTSGKSLILKRKFPGPGKTCKMAMVLESPGK